MTCANTYYLNSHMSSLDSRERRYEDAEDLAKSEMEDPKSQFYPWKTDNILEAMAEAPQEAIDRIIAGHGNDKELATAVREIVLGYWLETATDHFYSKSQD